MQPVSDERLAGRALRLRDLVLVMRKLQVHAAAMDVELLAKQRAAHRRTLDVPPGSAIAPGRRPLRLAGLRPLPQHEVERIFFARIYLNSLAGAQIIERLARKLAVAGEAA